jgi:hypothetical protein
MRGAQVDYTPPVLTDEPTYSRISNTEIFVFENLLNDSSPKVMTSFSNFIAEENQPAGDAEWVYNNPVSSSTSLYVDRERLGEFTNKHGYSVKYWTYEYHGYVRTHGKIWSKRYDAGGSRDDALTIFTFHYILDHQNLHTEDQIREFTDGLIFKSINGQTPDDNNEEHGQLTNIVYVNDDAPAGGDGSSWGNAFKYLQDALAVAESGDEIWVAEGTYTPDQGNGKTAGDRDARFILNGVEMYGGFSGTETSRNPQGSKSKTKISGAIDSNSSLWSYSLIDCNNSTIDGFVISEAKNYSSWQSVQVYQYPGGKFIDSNLSNLVIQDTEGYWSGITGYGILNISNCIFRKNVSLGTLRGSAFTFNEYYRKGQINFTNCVFQENSSYDGALIFDNTHYEFSLSLTNCIFYNNTGGYGAIRDIGTQDWTITNCIFVNNSAVDGQIYLGQDHLTMTNSIVWSNDENANTENRGMQDPTSDYRSWGSGVFEPYLNIVVDWEGDARALNVDPLFVNINDPDGPDDIWFTKDDGLQLRSTSPAINAGYSGLLPNDLNDLNRDGNKDELIPHDVLSQTRVIGSSVDIGAYEYDPENPPAQSFEVSIEVIGGGSVLGAGSYPEGGLVMLQAIPSSGYIFAEWGGDANVSNNPYAFKVHADRQISANFTQDLNDDDDDGLSNFDELITYGTSSNDPDSDDDGLLDGLEVEYDTNPLISDIKVLNLVRDNPSVISTNPASGYQDLLLGRNSNATPYTPSWFYMPNQGWMWSQKGVYPYFFDANSSNWMYFQSGHENPRFYHYGTKEWMTLE